MSPQQVTGNIGDPKEVECSVTAAQAAANITWTLNDRDITSDAHAEIRSNNLNVSLLYVFKIYQMFSMDKLGYESVKGL